MALLSSAMFDIHHWLKKSKSDVNDLTPKKKYFQASYYYFTPYNIFYKCHKNELEYYLIRPRPHTCHVIQKQVLYDDCLQDLTRNLIMWEITNRTKLYSGYGILTPNKTYGKRFNLKNRLHIFTGNSIFGWKTSVKVV